MTELETRLLLTVQLMEKFQEERERQFSATLSDLMKRLNNSATQFTTLSTQVKDLSRRIEHLHRILIRP
jgi:hypothetical protein